MAFINEVSNPDVLKQAVSMYIRSKRRQSQDEAVDYWGPLPIYDTEHFRRNFKLPIDLFDKIMADQDEYFKQKPDAAGQLGATPLQKICAAMRMLTSGV
ncbi:hypothetical protein H257_07061 [Aphanomyces astaci]|uniref:Uncharacterized protein n=1 Tax=Aphanomyces astaci TaxID=112090 RepID=W4GJG1_APHAT|nr:hypothetical protein H257_07061 [Aphanomyces astaci]ETV79845.1 hypothetical protein H257_07061 [Aphanomyces astaci]|eukprot:XP_009830781.1 hypothetical protein H257_07061 [Aphanomyces astaci]